MLKLGLTGNIASGKSQAEYIFKERSIPVIDADEIVEKLYNEKSFAQKTEKCFPNYGLVSDEKVDKNRLLKIIFNDLNFKEKFENFVHPFVLEEIEKFFAENSSQKLVVASVPLLFEAGWEKFFDKVLLVTSDDEIRLDRLMKRNSISKEDAKIRMAVQMAQAEKIKKADFVIENNSSLECFEEKIKNFIGSVK